MKISSVDLLFFFFQAEDGIRDGTVTGVQTCALPISYVGMHVLLYRPAPLFRISHRLFSTLAVWLFGGHVTSVEASRSGKGKGSKEGKGEGRGQAAAEGSTLVAFSPYVIPLYTLLTCAAGWGLKPWLDRVPLDAPLAFVIGM